VGIKDGVFDFGITGRLRISIDIYEREIELLSFEVDPPSQVDSKTSGRNFVLF
jgi:hypothetical protein